MKKLVKSIPQCILFLALFIGLWNLFDFLYSTFISQSRYFFDVYYDLLTPLGFGLLIFFILFVLGALKKKK
ncbi:MAG: hypothetical protein UFA98_02950 [Ruminococcus sp.]|nr:hypothetical protein [Ruminococcus sp.]